MQKRPNKLNHNAFEHTRNIVEKMFPQVQRKGFYIKNIKEAGVLGSMVKVAVSAVINIVGDSLNLRTYRRPRGGSSTIHYKVDELRGVNKEVVELLAGHEVPNHHIEYEVPEDMMNQNQLTVEMVGDGKGGLKPNVRPDGMVNAYINFPDPTEEIIKQAMEKKR